MNCHRFLLIFLLMSLLCGGCAATDTKIVAYETEITSEPAAAEVQRDDDDGEVVGYTPMIMDGEIEVSRQRSALSKTILGFGGLMAAAFTGAGIAEFGSDHEFASNNFGVAMIVSGLAVGAGFAWLSRIGDNMMIADTTQGVDQNIKVGKRFRSPSDQDYIDAMPATRFRLTATDHVTTPIRAEAGQTTAVELTSTTPPSMEVASDDPPSETQTPAEPPAEGTEDKPGFVSASPQPNAYALVVGIEDYRSVTPTPGARGDAEQFAELLESTFGVPHGNIHLLTDDNATRSDILSKLSWLQQNVPSDGRIYFFFSGHGAPDVESGNAYMLPYEGRPETLEFSGLPMDEILDQLELTEARDVLAFVDACFSGSGDRSSLPEGTRPLVPVQEATTEPKVALFSSSSASEISGNAADENQGLFTRHLLRAIGEARADIDGDGQISLAELDQYVTPRVSREARRENRDQNPHLTVSQELGDPADIILLWGLPRD